MTTKNKIPVATYDKLREACVACKLRWQSTVNVLQQKIDELNAEKNSKTFSIPIWSWIWKNFKIGFNLILPKRLK